MRNRAPRQRPRRRAAFTLIETALMTVIVGVGVLAIVAAQQAFHQQNGFSQRVGTALLLANEIRELTLNLPQHDPITGASVWGPEANETLPDPYSDDDRLPYDDLDDLDGFDSNTAPINGPVDALGQRIPGMPQWTQKVTVEKVEPQNVNGPANANYTDYVLRITCRVIYDAEGDDIEDPQEITRLTWLRADGP